MFGDLAKEPAKPQPSPSRYRVAHAMLEREDYDRLERAADSRGLHPDRLAKQIMENVLRGAELGGFLEV